MADYKVVDAEQLDADLTIVADAIRSKGGTTEQLAFPSGFKSVVENINTSKEEQEKSLDVVENGEYSILPDTGKVLSKANVNVNIPSDAKEEQTKTVDITENGTTEVIPDSGKVLSKVTVIVDVESGGSSEFIGVKYSEFDSYRGNPRVADARSLPVSIGDNLNGGYPYLFACISKNANGGWNTMVEDFYLPDGIQSLYNNMFYNTGAIKNIYGDLSNVDNIYVACFQNSNIEKFDYYCPNLTQIQTNAFNGCQNLIALTLRGNTLASLIHATNVFLNSPIAKGTGYIYVPRALVEDYKVATNWVTYANQFRALEDYTVDGTITGELDESKI